MSNEYLLTPECIFPSPVLALLPLLLPPTSSECLIYISAPRDFHLAHTSACSYCFSTLPFLTRLPSPSFAKLSLRFSTRRSRPSFLSHCIFFAGLRAHALFRRHFLLCRHSSSFLSFPPLLLPCLSAHFAFSAFSAAPITFFFVPVSRNFQVNSLLAAAVPAPV